MTDKRNKKSENQKSDFTEIAKLIVCLFSLGRTKTEIILKLSDFGFKPSRIGILLNTPTKDVTSILSRAKKYKKAKRSKTPSKNN